MEVRQPFLHLDSVGGGKGGREVEGGEEEGVAVDPFPVCGQILALPPVDKL